MVPTFLGLTINTPKEGDEDKAKKKKDSKNATPPHSLTLETASYTIQLGTESRIELLEWATGIARIFSSVTNKSIFDDTDACVKELYVDQYGDQSAIKQGEEQWIFVGGMVTCVGKSIQYTWDGLSFTHAKGDNFGTITWDGLTLTLVREGEDDVCFHWVQCAHEFKSTSDEKGNSQVVWNWTKERFMRFLPAPPDDKPVLWKFLRPVPPPVAMCVEIFSLLYAGKDLVPEVLIEVHEATIQERSKKRREGSKINERKKKKKRKSSKKSNKAIIKPESSEAEESMDEKEDVDQSEKKEESTKDEQVEDANEGDAEDKEAAKDKKESEGESEDGEASAEEDDKPASGDEEKKETPSEEDGEPASEEGEDEEEEKEDADEGSEAGESE
uniref:PH domain-containing protein n=1 Tax=Vannella robusta TaxID=1487602 RepID=A0A7S4IU38_9EUKA|mmetsp:Transcript_8674/g.10727  ORF Transcript_8674/g.10727 Transcript_8674/m.10727 type:complete len:386 (+) Transcript_8674:209-1366(+)